MKIIVKLALAFAGWYLFSALGFLPSFLENPLYKHFNAPIAAQTYYDNLKFEPGCYKKYINSGENGNLSSSQNSSQTSGIFGNFAYTSGEKTYMAVGKTLYVNDNNERQFHKIYDNLNQFTVGMAKFDETMLFVAAFGNIDRVQIYTDKVHDVYSEWFNKVRGQKTYGFGEWAYKTKPCKDTDFFTIAENLTSYLHRQNTSTITADQFVALLYYQSLGILLDYDNSNAIFVNKYTSDNRYHIYLVDSGLNFHRVCSIPVTTGHFYHEGYLYYSHENTVYRLNLSTCEEESYFSHNSSIKYLNYSTNCNGNLTVGSVSCDTARLYGDCHKAKGGTGFTTEEEFNQYANGYYMFAYPHHSIFMHDDFAGDGIISNTYAIEGV